MLTNGEIKLLAGLDNTDVIKGSSNFENMRNMVKKLANIGKIDFNGERSEVNVLLLKIDDVETFHKLKLLRHLGHSKHICCCFKCGLSHSSIDPIDCPLRGSHLPPCKECQESFTLIADLFDFHKKVNTKLERNNQFDYDPCLQNDMDTWWKEDIKMYHMNLIDYRAHIVQKEDEGIFDAEQYHDLDNDECIFILDYKVSIF